MIDALVDILLTFESYEGHGSALRVTRNDRGMQTVTQLAIADIVRVNLIQNNYR